MEPEPLNGTSGEGAGQEEQTESPEDAAQVTVDSWLLPYRIASVSVINQFFYILGGGGTKTYKQGLQHSDEMLRVCYSLRARCHEGCLI